MHHAVSKAGASMASWSMGCSDKRPELWHGAAAGTSTEQQEQRSPEVERGGQWLTYQAQVARQREAIRIRSKLGFTGLPLQAFRSKMCPVGRHARKSVHGASVPRTFNPSACLAPSVESYQTVQY